MIGRLLTEKLHDLLYYDTLFAREGATVASECTVLGTPASTCVSNPLGYLEEQENRWLALICGTTGQVVTATEYMVNFIDEYRESIHKPIKTSNTHL